MGDDDGDMPAWKTTKAKNKRKPPDDDGSDDASTSTKKTTAPSTSSEAVSPAKKIKIDDKNVEKISVDYSKPRASKASTADTVTTSKDEDKQDQENNSTHSKTKQVIQYTAKREKCKYWDKCYQTKENHLKEFYHPGDDIPEGGK